MARKQAPCPHWSTALLDDISHRASGHTPDQSKPEYWNGGIKWVSLADSSKLDKGLILNTDKEISEAGLNHSSAVLHPAGTVILSRDAGVGKSAVLGSSMAVSQHFIAWICDGRSCLHNWFLYHWLQYYKREFERIAVGSTIKTIGLPYFKKLTISFPAYEEQEKIAKVISTWDRALETLDRMIQNSETQKRALMQRLLTGRQRLPGFVNTTWRLVPLKTLCKVRRGASPRPINDPKWFSDTGRGWVRISDVTTSQTERLETTDQYLSPLGVEKSVPVDPGELIMSICATIGVPKIVGIPVCIHDGFVVFRDIVADLDLEFLYYLLEFNTRQLASSGQPGTQRNLNTTIVGDIQVPALSRNEQRRIAATFKTTDQLIRKQKQWLIQLQSQKAALMQQLLTGKRRVDVTEGADSLSAIG